MWAKKTFTTNTLLKVKLFNKPAIKKEATNRTKFIFLINKFVTKNSLKIKGIKNISRNFHLKFLQNLTNWFNQVKKRWKWKDMSLTAIISQLPLFVPKKKHVSSILFEEYRQNGKFSELKLTQAWS